MTITTVNGWQAYAPAGSPLGDVLGVSLQPPEQTFQPKPAGEYFSDPGHRQYFYSTRNLQRSQFAVSRMVSGNDPRAWTAEDERNLVNKLYMDWFGEEYDSVPDDTPLLNLDALAPRPLHRRELPPFKIAYQTFAEIKLRLTNTVISIKGHPYVVGKVKPYGSDFMLFVFNDEQKYYMVKYSDLNDLRSIPPMYIRYGSYAGWMARHPNRVYQQGINKQNTVIRTVDGLHAVTGATPGTLVASLNSRERMNWDSTMDKLMRTETLQAMRLSDDMAVMPQKGKLIACYRGRPLGGLQENVVTPFDEDDLLQGWIEKSAREVGFELRG